MLFRSMKGSDAVLPTIPDPFIAVGHPAGQRTRRPLRRPVRTLHSAAPDGGRRSRSRRRSRRADRRLSLPDRANRRTGHAKRGVSGRAPLYESDFLGFRLHAADTAFSRRRARSGRGGARRADRSRGGLGNPVSDVSDKKLSFLCQKGCFNYAMDFVPLHRRIFPGKLFRAGRSERPLTASWQAADALGGATSAESRLPPHGRSGLTIRSVRN